MSKRVMHVVLATFLVLAGSSGAHAAAVDDEAYDFARNVTVAVVLHELGHALIREFDLPVLGNEVTVADAFAIPVG